MFVELRNNEGNLITSGEAGSYREFLELEVRKGTDLTGLVVPKGTDLSDAHLCGGKLNNAWFIRCDLSRARFDRADLNGASFVWALMIRTSFGRAACQGAVFDRINCSSANWTRSDLRGAKFVESNLVDAGFRGSIIDGAIFTGASLYYAHLEGISIDEVTWPAPTMVLLASWGEVTPQLCADLMRFDADNHPDSSLFRIWASGGGCPYLAPGVSVQRAAHFLEIHQLWGTGQTCRPHDLMVRVLAEKCPGWGETKKQEFLATLTREQEESRARTHSEG